MVTYYVYARPCVNMYTLRSGRGDDVPSSMLQPTRSAQETFGPANIHSLGVAGLT